MGANAGTLCKKKDIQIKTIMKQLHYLLFAMA